MAGNDNILGYENEVKKGDGSYVVFGGSTVFFLSLAQRGLYKHFKTSYCGLGTFIQQLT